MNYIIKINNKRVNIKAENQTIIQVCENHGIEVPRFCYHEKLSIAGNCRMCLVEVKNSVKPVASCAMPATPNMEIFTNTKLVKKAREGILEFLLINHPLDCPICDQGGECDLQDQVMVFGSDRGRFYENKRAVEDKDCGPLIKTLMTRCIHCTRCIRFSNEIAGLNFFGVTGRGSKMEIGMYIKHVLDSELSGNVIDLCPVGALTSKPYAYIARPWELKSVETVDILNNICSKIKIDYRGYKILRVLPVINEMSNEDWIDDKTRFSFDGFFSERVESPMVLGSKNNKSIFSESYLIPVSWKKALLGIRVFFQRCGYLNGVRGFIGDLVELEAAIFFKDLLNSLGSASFYSNNLDCSYKSLEEDFSFKLDLRKLDRVDLALFLGLNLRIECPIINSRFRGSVIKGKTLVFSIGQKYNLTYFNKQLGNNSKELLKFLEGKHFLNTFLLRSTNPQVLFGKNLLNRVDSMNLYTSLKFFLFSLGYKYNLNQFNCGISGVGLKKIGFFPGKLNFDQTYNLSRDKKVCYPPILDEDVSKQGMLYYLLGLDLFKMKRKKPTDFVILQSHHNLKEPKKVNILLPSVTYLEQNSTFIDLFGNIKETNKIFKIKKDLQKVNYEILKMVSISLNKGAFLYYASKNRLKKHFSYKEMLEKGKIFFKENLNIEWYVLLFQNSFYKEGRYNFYKNNLILDYSLNMENCSLQFYKKKGKIFLQNRIKN